MENGKTTWERRGHIRTLRDGRQIYIKPTTVHRHDDDDEEFETPNMRTTQNPCVHTLAPKINEILARNSVTAPEGSSTLLFDGKFETTFRFEEVEWSDCLHVKPILPYYASGNTNPRYNPNYYKNSKWAKYDVGFEKYVIKVCLGYICCAISTFRGRPLSERLDYLSYEPHTYIRGGRRYISIGNIKIAFKTNQLNSGIVGAYRYEEGEITQFVPIWACPYARRIINLARDILILHEAAGVTLAPYTQSKYYLQRRNCHV